MFSRHFSYHCHCQKVLCTCDFPPCWLWSCRRRSQCTAGRWNVLSRTEQLWPPPGSSSPARSLSHTLLHRSCWEKEPGVFIWLYKDTLVSRGMHTSCKVQVTLQTCQFELVSVGVSDSQQQQAWYAERSCRTSPGWQNPTLWGRINANQTKKQRHSFTVNTNRRPEQEGVDKEKDKLSLPCVIQSYWPESELSGVAERLEGWTLLEQKLKKSWMWGESDSLQEPVWSSRRMEWMMRGSSLWQHSTHTWTQTRVTRWSQIQSFWIRF